jgi:hypothetical protein
MMPLGSLTPNYRTSRTPCTHEERLEASELPVERWVDIDVNDAIAKAAARLKSEAAPG